MATSDPIAQFMDGVAARGHEPSLAKATGTLKFEVVDGKRTERWLLTMAKGGIEVSRRNVHADATLRASRAVFGQVFQGKLNPTVAFLRGALQIEGDVGLIVLVQRLVPGPAKAGRR